MRTTLSIDDRIMQRLKTLAARRKTTISALVEAFLRNGLAEERAPHSEDLPNLPAFRVREVLVDVADRDALERAMRDER